MNRNIVLESLVFSIGVSFLTPYVEAKYLNNEEIYSYNNIAKNLNRILEPNSWDTKFAPMLTPRRNATSAVVDGKIYVIGGDNGAESNKVEVYDPKTNTWETKANMPTPRTYVSSAVVDDKIYVIGGVKGSTYLSTVEMYDPKTNTWETKANMPTVRSGLSSVSIDGKIYAIGGFTGVVESNKIEAYNPETNTWETKTDMPTARNVLTSNVVDGKIYAIGGLKDRTRLNVVEEYNPLTNTWKTKANMPMITSNLSSVAIENNIYCIGGHNGSTYLNKLQVYDVINDTWETKTDMPTARYGSVSSAIGNKIYTIGGYGDTFLNNTEVYISKLTLEEEVMNAVEKAEISGNMADIKKARELINNLPESIFKDELADRLNKVNHNESLIPKTMTSNMDVYIKSENILSIGLDTNSITFEDFSGVEDIEKLNAVNISIDSSLPYEVNSYLVTEIQNPDKNKVMDKQILNIKESSEADYKAFNNINEKLILKDNNPSGNDLTHGIDLKLKGGLAYKADNYKATIKFEANQK